MGDRSEGELSQTQQLTSGMYYLTLDLSESLFFSLRNGADVYHLGLV